MITGLDHAVVLVRDIEAGVAGYQTLLGRAPVWRAQSDGAATAIFVLNNTSLELMAPAGEGEAAGRVRAVLERQGEGLASLAFEVGDIEKAHHRLTRLGLAPEAISDGASTNLASGRTLTWKRTRASAESTHGIRLFFLQRGESLARSPEIAPAPVDALDHLVIATPDPERTAALYGARLGLDMKLDRTIEALGTRFLFFRTDGLVFEVIHRLKDGRSDGPDKIYGVSWRVADVAATRTRLEQAGLEVSELREGRKPGTQVFTVRTGTFGVPTIVIQQDKREA
ncbi:MULTISPECIES: VOC family protein [unclassified Afipia]|uniref:VOC family protein n=1 Tax=unclassified Afipia TaxID=2642050 RepID=UPI000463A0D3|nr:MULTISPECIES: VOC family protein [unclassified Afipia]MAH71418.1 glyoxalase [Afipia sp.]OUX59270.1 MAG: glyoxalase [Afipia sp. TMED4]HAQ95350.1 glyoxalase [Afipia sp.]HBF56197.1 glyoxalase [Afipia sp.]